MRYEETNNHSNTKKVVHITAEDGVSSVDRGLKRKIEAATTHVEVPSDKEKIILNHLFNTYLPNLLKLCRSMWGCSLYSKTQILF